MLMDYENNVFLAPAHLVVVNEGPLSLNSTGPTRTPTPTRTSLPTSARGSSHGSWRVRHTRKSACCGTCGRPTAAARMAVDLSTGFCPTHAFSREDVRWRCVYTCMCTVHDKLLCTRLQNYTIGASLMLVSMSVSVSVPWGSSLKQLVVVNVV